MDVLCNVATGVVPSRVMYEDFIRQSNKTTINKTKTRNIT